MITSMDQVIQKSSVAFKCMQLQIGLGQSINRVRLLAVGKERKTSSLIQFVNRIIKNSIEPSWVDTDMAAILMAMYEKEIYINTTFDSTFTPQLNNTGKFIDGSTLEVFIPTTGLLEGIHDINMPLSDWQDVHTIKLMYADSNELPVEWYDQIKFKKDKPTVALFSVSTVALVLQYMAFAKERKIDIVMDNCSQFCYECIIPNLRTDLIENWILSSVMTKLSGKQILYPEAKDLAGSAIQKFEDELAFRIGGFMNDGQTLDKLLNTEWLKGQSIIKILKGRLLNYKVGKKARYVAFNDLLFKWFDDIMMFMLHNGSGMVKSTTLRMLTQKKYRLIRGKRPEHAIRIPYLKLLYVTQMDEYGKLLEVDLTSIEEESEQTEEFSEIE